VAGYSGTPLPRKLGIKPEASVALVEAPAELPGLLVPWPEGASIVPLGDGLDVVLFFVTERAALAARFEDLGRHVFPGGALWICWPKRSSGAASDLTEGVLREVVLPSGLVDTKVCAIDETWSGLRFVWRREAR
jgi:hypothetical protein